MALVDEMKYNRIRDNLFDANKLSLEEFQELEVREQKKVIEGASLNLIRYLRELVDVGTKGRCKSTEN